MDGSLDLPGLDTSKPTISSAVMKTHFGAFIIPVILFFACSPKQRDLSNAYIDSFSEESDADFFREVFSDIRAIPMDLADHLLGSNAFLRFEKADDGFLLTDRQAGSIYLLDGDGSLLTHISKIGRGPGEYNEIQHAVYKNHSIIVLADGSHVIEYSESGDLVKEAVFEEWFADLAPLEENGYALFEYRDCGENEVEDRIIITDSAFVKKRSFLPLEYQLFNYGALTFGVVGENGRYLCVQQSCPVIYKCDRDTVITTYTFDLHKKEFPAKMLEADDYETILEVLMGTPDMYGIASAFENRDYLLLALSHLVDGDESRIGHWLINKKDLESRIEYQDLKGPLFEFFGPPQLLTADNEVVYVCEASLYDTVMDLIPGLSDVANVFQEGSPDNVLLFCKIAK